MTDWQNILEQDSSTEIRFPTSEEACITTPPGFGRSEYHRMIDELWSEGEKQCRTDLERGIDLMDESAQVVAESLQSLYENTVSGEFDSEQYRDDCMKTALGVAFFSGSPGFTAFDWAGEGIIHNIERPSYTVANSIYDLSDGETRAARIFYSEQDREITVAPPLWRDKGLDRDVLEDTVSYIESFEA